MHGIEKSFPDVRAIRRGEFKLRAGEVHALLGENGAGKSTFVKVLAGARRADAGTIHVNGEKLRVATPHDSARAGIAVVYQESPTGHATKLTRTTKSEWVAPAPFLFRAASRRSTQASGPCYPPNSG